jgi:hypothetical protein
VSPRVPMLLRRGLMLDATLVVDSDPERPAALVDSGDVRVVVKDVASGARQAFSFPARVPVPVFGVVIDRRPARSVAGTALLGRAQVAA